MQKSKIITLLKSLDNQDLKKLDKFLRSPYFTSNKTTYQLFQILRAYHPGFDNKAVFKPNLCKKLFPDTPTNIHKLDKQLSFLKQHIEVFIAMEAFQAEPVLMDTLKTIKLTDHKNFQLFEEHYKNIYKQIVNKKKKTAQDHWHLFQLKEEWYGHPSVIKEEVEEQEVWSMLQFLDRAWVNKRLIFLAELIGRKKYIQGNPIPLSELKMFFDYLQQSGILKDNPAGTLAKMVIDMLLDPTNETKLKESQQYLQDHTAHLPDSLIKNIFYLLTNQLMDWYRTKPEEYLPHIFSWYQYGLKNDFFFHKGAMLYTTYKNISSTASLLGDFDFARRFNIKYHKYVPLEFREEVRLYCDAFLLFCLEKFEDAYDLIPPKKFSTGRLDTSFRTLRLQCLYEIKKGSPNTKMDLLFTGLDAYEKTITRSKDIVEHKKIRLLNFIKILRKIYSESKKARPSKARLKLIDQDLSDQLQVLLADWLILKLNELKKV